MKNDLTRTEEFLNEIIEEKSIQHVETGLKSLESTLNGCDDIPDRRRKDMLDIIRFMKPDFTMIKNYFLECESNL